MNFQFCQLYWSSSSSSSSSVIQLDMIKIQNQFLIELDNNNEYIQLLTQPNALELVLISIIDTKHFYYYYYYYYYCYSNKIQQIMKKNIDEYCIFVSSISNSIIYTDLDEQQ